MQRPKTPPRHVIHSQSPPPRPARCPEKAPLTRRQSRSPQLRRLWSRGVDASGTRRLMIYTCFYEA